MKAWKCIVFLIFILTVFHDLRYPKLWKTAHVGGLKVMSRVTETLQALLINAGKASEAFLVTFMTEAAEVPDFEIIEIT